MSNICSICLVESSIVKDDEIFSYKGKDLTVRDLSFYECPECGEQFVDSALDKENSILIREAKKELDGLLSSKEIYRVREHLEITQHEASKIFGGGLNAFSKYERGEVSQSEAMDKLMRAAMSVDGLFEWLCKDARVRPARELHSKIKNSKSFLTEAPHEDFEVIVFDTYIKTFSSINRHMRLGVIEKHDHGAKSFRSIAFYSDCSEDLLEMRH